LLLLTPKQLENQFGILGDSLGDLRIRICKLLDQRLEHVWVLGNHFAELCDLRVVAKCVDVDSLRSATPTAQCVARCGNTLLLLLLLLLGKLENTLVPKSRGKK
jgi:hypothetical protein